MLCTRVSLSELYTSETALCTYVCIYQAHSQDFWNGDCYIMHRMQSGGWPYSEDGRDSSKAPSLRVAVLRTAVFRSLRSNRNY